MTSTPDMLKVATDFYKNLLHLKLNPKFILALVSGLTQSLSLRRIITCWKNPFLRMKKKNAIMSSYANGAPGRDGLSFLFYQTFGVCLKTYCMWLVKDFEDGVLDVYRFNFPIITLIPKEPDAKEMKKKSSY